MAPHSSILAWEILWTEQPGGLQFMESQELDTTQQLKPPPPRKQDYPIVRIKQKHLEENLETQRMVIIREPGQHNPTRFLIYLSSLLWPQESEGTCSFGREQEAKSRWRDGLWGVSQLPGWKAPSLSPLDVCLYLRSRLLILSPVVLDCTQRAAQGLT